ncbi:hypothetical protein Pelo_19957 [Pelomyxa schiedti]|nr:hypothetical protein Pelo_19957 [Pelomyxa schiedti]
MADDDTLAQPPVRSTAAYRYIVNHSKRQYVDKSGCLSLSIHPLPLLLAEGNGRGCGDFVIVVRGEPEAYDFLGGGAVAAREQDDRLVVLPHFWEGFDFPEIIESKWPQQPWVISTNYNMFTPPSPVILLDFGC